MNSPVVHRKHVVHRKYNEFRCEICGQEVTAQQYRMYHTCSDRKCRYEYNGRLRAQLHESQERHEQARISFWHELEGQRDQLASENAIEDANKYLPVCVPHLKTQLAPVSLQRREQLRKHLCTLLEDIASSDECNADLETAGEGDAINDVDVPSKAPTLLEAACATCGGYCCQEGGQTAFLNANKLSEQLRSNPSLSAETIVEAYLSKVPESAYLDSCLFHSATGCALPRSMRSDLCQTFECYGLKSIHELIAEKPVDGLFIASTVNEALIDYRFVESPKRSPVRAR